MACVTLEVPPGQADAVLYTLLDLYQVKGESLHASASDYLRRGGSPDALLEHRFELLALDHLIDQFGWRRRRFEGPVRVSGSRDLLRRAVALAADDVGDRVGRCCGDLLDDPGARAATREAVADVSALLGLLEALERAPESDVRA
jgi:hypothetical protein